MAMISDILPALAVAGLAFVSTSGIVVWTRAKLAAVDQSLAHAEAMTAMAEAKSRLEAIRWA